MAMYTDTFVSQFNINIIIDYPNNIKIGYFKLTLVNSLKYVILFILLCF